MSITLIIVMLALGGVVGFARHIQHYKALVLSLKNRGFDVANFEVGYLNYGSGGCIKKLNELSLKFNSQLLENEQGLILRCKRVYSFQAASIMALLFYFLGTLFGGSFE